MGMVKKSISVTDQQAGWIKAQIETGNYGNESEVLTVSGATLKSRISVPHSLTVNKVA